MYNQDKMDKLTRQGSGRHMPHNSTMHTAKPTQLSFYSGSWVDVLQGVKILYCLWIHTQDPLPEHNQNTLTDVHACLMDAIGWFEEEWKIPLDKGSFILLFTCHLLI